MAITIAQRIKDLRKEKGFTQESLAEKVEPPLGREHVSHYENGRQVPSSIVQERIALAFGMKLHEFLKGVTFIKPKVKAKTSKLAPTAA